jgi:hypothetical protein
MNDTEKKPETDVENAAAQAQDVCVDASNAPEEISVESPSESLNPVETSGACTDEGNGAVEPVAIAEASAETTETPADAASESSGDDVAVTN